ncbi:MAG: hypothetical protein OXC40_05850, partial [Proteobacteria bacterium]|nr:hypothetical protein [Pseudomonadota bacterium]
MATFLVTLMIMVSGCRTNGHSPHDHNLLASDLEPSTLLPYMKLAKIAKTNQYRFLVCDSSLSGCVNPYVTMKGQEVRFLLFPLAASLSQESGLLGWAMNWFVRDKEKGAACS